jgi:hypothetical protein
MCPILSIIVGGKILTTYIMKHDMVTMPRKEYLAEHARLGKVLKEAKTAAAAKEYARQMAEVKMRMARPHAKGPMMTYNRKQCLEY